MSLRWQRQASLLNIALRSTSFQNLNSNPEIIINIRSYQQQRLRIQKDPYEKDWKVLQVAENSDQDEVRRAYLNLAKIYHPDSGSKEADTSKFQEIDTAYKNLLRKFADERHNDHKIEGEYGLYYKEKAGDPTDKKTETEEKEEPDIKHAAPQHRQYLNFDGIGVGTPAQREKQYQNYRANRAAANVFEHRINKVASAMGVDETALAKDTREAKKIKTRLGMARLVEDMIQESMSRGDFENLSGKGKPLKPEGSSNNPYIDFTTHKMNQILIDNGFAPEWILLEKEIRQEITEIRQKLRIERHKYGEELGSFEELNWHKLTSALQPQFDILNQKINKYNLVVPIMTRQIIGLQMERESRNALKNYSKELHEAWRARKPETENQSLDPAQKHATHSDNQSFIGMMFSMFK